MAEKINNTYFFRKPQGGGGGSSDAVLYTEQTLTEAQQMQARKNQDLYYEESSTISVPEYYNAGGAPTSSMTYSPNTYFVGFSDFEDCLYAGMVGVPYNEPIGVSGMVVDSVQLKLNNQYHDAEVVTQTNDYILVKYAESQYRSYYGVVVWADSASVTIPGMGTLTVPQGTWLSCNCGTDGGYFDIDYYVQEIKLAYQTTITTTHQIPYKYIPTQSINASADNSHFPTSKAVYDYVRNNAASGCVKYDTSQNLSSQNQMRARKNQGLYCSTVISGGSIDWDGDTSSIVPIMFLGQIPMYRIAESPTDIPIDSILNYENESQEIESFDRKSTIADLFPDAQGDGLLCINNSEMAVVLIAQNLVFESDVLNGIYFTANVRALNYSTYSKIENKISWDYIEENENAIVRIHDITHNVMHYGNCEIRVEEETEIEILPGNGYDDTSISYASIYGDVESLGIVTKAGSQHLFLSPLSSGKVLALVTSNNPKIGGVWVSFICSAETNN